MKRRLFAALLCCALLASLAPAALALGAFYDVTDQDTARDVEVLRLMGVVGGNGDGTFRPNDTLTRAEFCKMAVALMDKRNAVTRYAKSTVFPDLRAPHWAVGYVNYAASKDVGMIHGMPDGTFQPDRAITYGEAVAILTRQLGYQDKDTNGIWPDGYIALAGEAGITRGLTISGGASITRAQAARLFVNAMSAENDEGTTLLTKLGYSADLSKETTLYNVDMTNGELNIKDGKVKMERPTDSSLLNGLKGYVVKKGSEAVTFLPSTSTKNKIALSDAAVIVREDGSTAGFESLTGGVTNYTIYKNGLRTSASALKRYDVAVYRPEQNAILVTDTRISVWYESCKPSPSAPDTIKVLGTTFDVLPSAQQSLSVFHPGEAIVVFLSSDGRIAGAMSPGGSITGNAYAYVSKSGEVSLICGGSLMALDCPAPDNTAGKVGRISQTKTGANAPKVYISAQSNSISGALDVTAGRLGGIRISDNALILYNGKMTALKEIEEQKISSDRISYARENGNVVDILVIDDTTVKNEIYGRIVITGTWVPADPDEGTAGYDSNRKIVIDCKTESYEIHNAISEGTIVSAKHNKIGPPYLENVEPMEKLSNIPASSWLGKTAVMVNGRTYTIPDSVICWNRDTESWFKDFDEAYDYGGTWDLYVKDSVVRVIEVRS